MFKIVQCKVHDRPLPELPDRRLFRSSDSFRPKTGLELELMFRMSERMPRACESAIWPCVNVSCAII